MTNETMPWANEERQRQGPALSKAVSGEVKKNNYRATTKASRTTAAGVEQTEKILDVFSATWM